MGSLSKRMTFYVSRLTDGVEGLMKRIALAVDEAVIYGTPVDTGFARSNWIVSLGNPTTGTISPYSPGNKLGIGESPNARGAIAQGRAVIDGFTIGRVIYIVNNTPYIGVLNSPSTPSRQAAPFFVQTAILAGVQAGLSKSLLGNP